MGMQGRTAVQRVAAVGAGVILAGSLWSGTAMAQDTGGTTATSSAAGDCNALAATLNGLLGQLTAAQSALNTSILGGLDTSAASTLVNTLQAQANNLETQLGLCTANSSATSAQAAPYPGPNPKPYDCYPAYKEGYPDHPGYNDPFYPGGASASAAPAASSGGTNPLGIAAANPAGISDSSTGVPAAAPAAQPQSAPVQGYAAAPQAAAPAAAPGYATGAGYGGGSYQQPYSNTSGGGANGMYGATPYGDNAGYTGSTYGGDYGYGSDYGYGHDGYKKDDHRPGCYPPGKQSSYQPHNNGDDNNDYGQCNNVPTGAVNTGDGSTDPTEERTTS